MAIDEESAPLLAVVDEKKRNYTRDVYVLSLAFLLIFLSFGAAQNLQTTVNTEGDLGTICLGILYTSFTVFTLVASPVVRSLGSKKALVLGTTGYWLFVAANLVPSWYTMVPASLYLGFAASIIWVAEGTYLTSTARSHSQESNLHEGTIIGSFNGIFFGVFASHQVIGNLITLALLSDGTGGSTSGTTLLFLVFLFVMTFGIVLMCFLQKTDTKGDEDVSVSSVSFYSSVISLSKSAITPLFDVRMLLIIPLIAYSGLQQAFVWAEYTKYIVKPALGVSGVGGAMAVYGGFDALCSVAVGKLTSGVKSITVIVSAGVFVQLAVLIWILVEFSFSSGISGTFNPLLIAALWGIGDGIFNTQLNALFGLLFKNDMVSNLQELTVLSKQDIDYYTSKFEQNNFTGGINYYRAIDLNWELTSAWSGAKVNVPAKFIVGDLDLVYNIPGAKDYIHNGQFKKDVPQLEEVIVLEGAAHFINQEKPDEINNHILSFLKKF